MELVLVAVRITISNFLLFSGINYDQFFILKLRKDHYSE